MALTQEQVDWWFSQNPTATAEQVAEAVKGAGGLEANAGLADMIANRYQIAPTQVTDYYSQYVAPPAAVEQPVAKAPEPDYYAQQFTPDVYETPAPVYTPSPTNAYFQANPDVAAAYAANSYGMSADAFADFHYNNYGKNEGRYSPSGEPPPRAVVSTPSEPVYTPSPTPTYSSTDEQGTPIYDYSTPAVVEQPVTQTPVSTPSIVDTAINTLTNTPPTTNEELLAIVNQPQATATPPAQVPATNQYTKENWPTINYGTTGTEGDVLTRTTTSDGTPFYLRGEEGGEYQNPATVESYAPFIGADGKTYYNVYAPTFGSGKAWNETPITKVLTEAQYNALRGGSNALVNMLNSPVGSFALNALGPYGQIINAANQASQGNELGAILSGLNAAGGLGVTDIGGIDIKTAQNVARGLNAIEKNDLMGAFTAGSNLLGGIPGEYATATNLASAGLALKNNDAAGFASAMSDLTKNPDLKIAAAAVKLLDAVNANTINPSALQSAINGLNSAITKSSSATTSTASTAPAITTLSAEDLAELQPGELQAYQNGGVQGLAEFRRDMRLLNSLTTSGRTGDDMGGNVIETTGTTTETTTPTSTSGATNTNTTDLGSLLDEITATGKNTDSGLSNQDILDMINGTDDTVVVKGNANTPVTDTGTTPEVGGGKATDLGNVTIVGDRPTDTVTGATGADTITGATGNDNVDTVTVTGGTGNDTVTGGTDNDSVTGGTGNDSVTGGTGNDDVEELVVTDKKECAPGFHDDGTGLCVPDDDEEEENPCADGFHLEDGLCVPDDDVKEDTECPEGYIRNLETGACEPVEVKPPVVQPPVVKPPVVKPPVVTPTTTPTQQVEQQRVDVKTPEGKDIEYIYDWESIFPNRPEPEPESKSKQKSKKKMAGGGAINDALDVNNELIRILRG
jgi:hypothetical protein